MAPGEAPRKRVATKRARGGRADGGDLVQQLNAMVAELIRENRNLKRQVDRLTERGSAAASTAVERSLRTIQRRVQRALSGPVKKKRGATRKTPTKKRT